LQENQESTPQVLNYFLSKLYISWLVVFLAFPYSILDMKSTRADVRLEI
jgi:hypothetical protein